MRRAPRTASRSLLVLASGFALVLLAACTSSGDATMGMSPPTAIGAAGTAMPPLGDEGASRAPPAVAALPAAAPLRAPGDGSLRAGPIQFLPVVGAPARTVEALSEALARSAAERGVAILPSAGAPAPVRLKGYLSAIGEGRETVVVYVWDLIDPAGERVGRIQGQERVGASAADPWDAIDGAALRAIASGTIEEFLRSGSGRG